MNQLRVYDDIQTAMKDCRIRVKIKKDKTLGLIAEVYKEEISYLEKLIVVCNNIKPNEKLVGRFKSELEAEDYITQLSKLPELMEDLFNKGNSNDFFIYSDYDSLKEAYDDVKYFVTTGSKKLHINKSIIIEDDSGFHLCYPTIEFNIVYSSKNRRDCVEFIRREGGR